MLYFLTFTLFLAQASKALPSSDVKITWSYENFPLKINIAEVAEEKKVFISETNSFKNIKDSIIKKKLTDNIIRAEHKTSSPFALLIENTTDQDYYFFAVPHELNPHHASAGHYFECLCNGRVFMVPANSSWYRIVRLNLNDSFQKIKKFEINHKIVGLKKNEVMLNYKDRLYVP